MYLFLLVSHILVGIATGVAAAYAGIVLWKRTSDAYRTSALVLGFLATYELASGTALAVVSRTISAQSLCNNIALYLSAVFVVEVLLFVRMKRASTPFPLVQTISPVLGGLAALASAAILGF